MKIFFGSLFFIVVNASSLNVIASDPGLPKEVRGLCIGAPGYERVDEFVTFMDTELRSRRINVLVLRIDYNYQYTSHPEIVTTQKRKQDSAQSTALSASEIKKIVQACKRNGILLVPLVNLLGHQSWASNMGAFLRAYPQFDETPWVEFPKEYKWPNDDSLYCKSYCPLHPDVHTIVYDLVNEIMDVCETDHFHAGMDEVFYIGASKCPRCGGKDRSVLFADEVNRISKHVKSRGGRLWIWGDRMLDAAATGLGIWEASGNDTYRSIDLIDRSVVINDWHYVSAPETPAYFAQKGYAVMICPWNRPDVAIGQVVNYRTFKSTAPASYASNFTGFIQTVWTNADNFMDYFSGKAEEKKGSTVGCFKAIFEAMDK
jgi:hypothetical protein